MKRNFLRFLRPLCFILLILVIRYLPYLLSFFSPYFLQQPKLLNIIGTAEVPGLVEETLIAPVNTNQNVLTTHSYAGAVTIMISGEGEMDSDTGHDALYHYGKQFEDGKQPLYCCFEGLIIDDEPITRFRFFFGNVHVGSGEPPEYNPQHRYAFVYQLGSELRKIAFRLTNGNPDTQGSPFTVFVTTENRIYSPGR